MHPEKNFLFNFLCAEVNPDFALYSYVVQCIIQQPAHLSEISKANDEEGIIVHVVRNAARFTTLLEVLYDKRPTTPGSSSISHETTKLLNHLLPHLLELLDKDPLVGLLVCGLRLCIPAKPTALRETAKVLTFEPSILIGLVSHPLGFECSKEWISSRELWNSSPKVLECWTEILLQATHQCPADHDETTSIQRWNSMNRLGVLLKGLEADLEKLSNLPNQIVTKADLPSLESMTKLQVGDKKSGPKVAAKEVELLSSLDFEILSLLSTFDLTKPNSIHHIQSHLRWIEVDGTLDILRAVVDSFPCKLCNKRGSSDFVQASPSEPLIDLENVETQDKPIKDCFGKQVGTWKVLLSARALKAMHALYESGDFKAINTKLKDLANGIWSYELAGSEAQRKKLEIPLARMKCGKSNFILWQVDISDMSEIEGLQQIVKVWEIGPHEKVSRAIDRVIVLQSVYSTEMVRLCRQRPAKSKSKFVPSHSPLVTSSNTLASSKNKLDIREVDKEVIEMANKFYSLTEPVIRSVLANDLLAEFPFDMSAEEMRIIHHFDSASLILGRSGTGKTTCLVFKLVSKYVARAKFKDEKNLRQIMLTRSNFLAEKLRNYTQRLIEPLTLRSLNMESLPENEGVSRGQMYDNTPSKTVLDLTDQSFPLICTFDQFLQILEGTARIMDRKNFSDCSGTFTENHPDPNMPQEPVDFYSFKVDYWPRFPDYLTKRLSLELVFAEIMGVIKGSNSSAKSLAPLSRDEYLARSSRLAPNFVMEDDRARLYDVFLLYEKLKRERGEVDDADRVIKLSRTIKEDKNFKRHLSDAFDEVYIDEVQDQRCIDFDLLLKIVTDARGFHFAGDTAQAISHDSTFRFDDVKSLFFDHFSLASLSTNQCQLAKPTLFTLSKNYRSHHGILAFASLVMELLWKGFPEMVDRLEPEVGQLRGPKPVLFIGCSPDILVTSNVSLVDISEHNSDFGAEQVILVRDDKAKSKLQSEIGDVALILTILQSKGMEFEDVILWDFFTSSPCQSGMRQLSTLLNIDGKKMDTRKHSGMCSELKNLYVAITRARMRLVMIESSESAAAPIEKLLTMYEQEQLVETTRPGDKNFDEQKKNLRAVSAIDPRKWAQRGEELLRNKLYKDAAGCFRKAKLPRKETEANAYAFEGDGRVCASAKDIDGFTRNMRAAVQAFLEIQRIDEASRLLIQLGDLEAAAELWSKAGKHERAAPLFLSAALFGRACECFHIDKQYYEAANALLKGELFEELLPYLKQNGNHMEPAQYRRLSKFCKLLLKQGRISHQYRKLAIELLGSLEEQESFFREYEMHDELIELYRQQERFGDLFYYFENAGRINEALDIAREAAIKKKQKEEEIEEATRQERVRSIIEKLGFAARVSESSLNAAKKIQAKEPKSLPKASVPSARGLEQQDSLATEHAFDMSISDERIIRVLDYHWAAHFMVQAQSVPENLAAVPVEEIDSTISPLFKRNENWKAAYKFFSHCEEPEKMKYEPEVEDLVVKGFLALCIILKDGFPASLTSLHPTALGIIDFASVVIRSILTESDSPFSSLPRLYAGIFARGELLDQDMVLSWSPLSDDPGIQEPDKVNLSSTAKSFVLRKLGAVMMTIEGILKTSFENRWPRRCLYYLMTKRCGREECPQLHKSVRTSDYSAMLRDLMRVSNLVCHWSALHYHDVLGHPFQAGYKGRRRYWLERMIRELTFTSSFDQTASVLLEARAELRTGLGMAAARHCIENHLFYRLSSEWRDRNGLSSLLDQVQFARFLGVDVEHSFIKALRSKLRTHSDERALELLHTLSSLELDRFEQNAEKFQSNLKTFLGRLANALPRHFKSLHSLSWAFEYLVCYLLVQSFSGTIVLPQSWADLHLRRGMEGVMRSSKSKSLDEVDVYRQCLVSLLRSFCRMITKIYSEPISVEFDTSFAQFSYYQRMLPQRNAETLAIAALNIACSQTPPRGVGNLWADMREVLALPSHHHIRLQHKSLSELPQLLYTVFSRYEDKDALVMVLRGPGTQHPLSQRLATLGVPCVAMDELIPDSHLESSMKPSQSEEDASENEQYSDAQAVAVRIIQRFWRTRIPKLQARQAWLKSDEAQVVARFLKMTEKVRARYPRTTQTIPMMVLLMTQGIGLKSRLDKFCSAGDALRKELLAAISDGTLELTVCERLDDFHERLHQSISKIQNMRTQFLGSYLQQLLNEGDLHSIRKFIGKVENETRDAEEQFELAMAALENLH